MFGMSVNEVPGWLVAMAPSAIGVPVAATPGLVPHCDVLTAEVLGVLDAVDVFAGVVVVPVVLLLLLLLLLQPAAARAIAAASTIVLRADRAGISLFICPLRAVSFQGLAPALSQLTVTTILIESGGLLIANSKASGAVNIHLCGVGDV